MGRLIYGTFAFFHIFVRACVALLNLCDYDAMNPSKPLRCRVEQQSFIDSEFDFRYSNSSNSMNDIEIDFSNLTVIEYNVDKNGYGGDGWNEEGLTGILSAINHASRGQVDILILSEIARDCPDYGDSVNGAAFIAQSLRMEYVYVVEFLSMEGSSARADTSHECTIGNAILSNRPITHVTAKTFSSQCCMFSNRAGGRSVIQAAIPALNLIVSSSHLESGKSASDFVEAAIVRENQTKELIALSNEAEAEYQVHLSETEQSSQNRKLLAKPLILIGGDFNSPLRQFNIGKAFKCFFDPIGAKRTWPNRNTAVDRFMSAFGLASYDYLFFRNYQSFEISGDICSDSQCFGYSDHFPLVFHLSNKKSSSISLANLNRNL